MRLTVLLVSICLSFSVFGQGRSIDLRTIITDPADGDSFVSPSKRLVTVYLVNNGPDTIWPKDEFSVKFIFSAFHIFPQFLSFGQYVYPGDSFRYQRELDISYSGDVASMKFCAEAFAFSKGRDSIRSETGITDENNKHCITTKHIDSADNASVSQHLTTNTTSVYPNPTLGSTTVTCRQEIQSVTILNVNGQVVKTLDNVSSNSVTVSLQEQRSGIYFLQIQSGQHWFTEKLVYTP